ncbi:MAG: ABC transporter permease [Bacteroidota bacterium]
MISYYLRAAVRRFSKDKIYSILNLLGLSVGLATSIIILQYVKFEFSFDNFHSQYDDLYRVVNDRYHKGDKTQSSTLTYPTIGRLMKQDINEVENHTRLLVPIGDALIKANEQFFIGDHSLFVDDQFLVLFDFPIVLGDRNVVFDRQTAMITESTAKKYFGEVDFRQLIGKEIYWGNSGPFTVKAILDDVPRNSHLQFDLLLPYKSLYDADNQEPDNGMTWSNARHYIQLKEGVDPVKLNNQLKDFSNRYFEGGKVTGSTEKFLLQPLSEVHLQPVDEFEYAQVTNGKVVWTMLIIAGLIFSVALVNYVNMTSSRTVERVKEVQVKKAMGATRGQLSYQFMVESIGTVVLITIMALIMVDLSQPWFNNLIHEELHWVTLFYPFDVFSLAIVSVVMIGIVISISLPNLMLSSRLNIRLLKANPSSGLRYGAVRNGLIIFQFLVSGVLFGGALVVSEQLDYILEADLGLNIEDKLVISPPRRTAFDSTFNVKIRGFKQSVSKLAGVESVTTTQFIPGNRLHRNNEIVMPSKPAIGTLSMNFNTVDEDFFEVFEVAFLSGRDFSTSDYSFNWDEVNTLIINTAAMRALQKDEQSALGKKIEVGGKSWTIIGVVDDFHQQSLQHIKEPILFMPDHWSGDYLVLQLSTDDYQSIIDHVKGEFDLFFPDNAFDYFFLEDKYNDQYSGDVQFKRIINIFTILAVFISCIGLISLAAYVAKRRTKEVGIRKVLGASVLQVVQLLSFSFLKLVLLATVVSIPVAYYASISWLEAYAYRINLNLYLFLLPVVGLALLTLIVVASQTIKSALKDPVETLRYE